MSLNGKLESVLESRRRRNILRRLPSPSRSGPSDSSKLIDFVSNDYLSLLSYAPLRSRFLAALEAEPAILGSGASRLLVNHECHYTLEERLRAFFDAPAALLFNSGYDANSSLFASVPQDGDAVVYDEYIHASVRDGMRASRLARPNNAGEGRKSLLPFAHNSVSSLRTVLSDLLHDKERGATFRNGTSSVFVVVESLYSMDGTIAPLPHIVDVLEKVFPRGNAYLIVDEAHATGLYGPLGRGLVAHSRLETKVFVRLHTFGKALAVSGAVLLTTPLVKQYLLNYARPLIYTTALSCSTVVAINCSIDILEDGTSTKLANALQDLCRYALQSLQTRFTVVSPAIVTLPSHLVAVSSSDLVVPIIPIMTPTPRKLCEHLRKIGLNARPITWPTVPKGKDRVRICMHASTTKEDVDRLVDGIVSWALQEQENGEKPSTDVTHAKL